MSEHARAGAGTQAVGFACSYVPEEIIMAAGLVPRRLIPESRPQEADAHIYPNTCFYVKSLLAAALDGGAAEADAFVIANSCDGMRKLYDIWQHYVPGVPAYYLDVPKKRDAEAIDYFASELRRFASALEAGFPGAAVTEASLAEAIRTCNAIRRQMGRVLQLQAAAQPQVRGSDFLELTLAGVELRPHEVEAGLTRYLAHVEPANGHQAGPRILVTGNIINRPDLVALIEEAGAHVVALDSCFGVRHYDRLVEEGTANPLLALAERYLRRSPCPRMDGCAQRFRDVQHLAETANADGILYSTVKFCDSSAYDVPLLAESCDRAGIPFLAVENDYEWTGMGQLQTRVEAFLELVAQGGE